MDSAVSAKKATTIGRSKKPSQEWSKMISDCLRLFSTSSPRIRPMMIGAAEKP